MDFVCISCVAIWAIWNRTTRLAWSLGVFYILRTLNQKYFFLGRSEGILYSYPGLPSVTISYFDTNDFYFSGHVGSCTIYTMELIALGWSKMGNVGMTIIINQWLFLTFTRSHYVIDMVSAVIVGITAHRIGEYIVYFSDVLILRFRKARR